MASILKSIAGYTKQHLYDHLPTISHTVQEKRTRHAGHCLKNKHEVICDIFLWSLICELILVSLLAKNYIYQLCANNVCRLEDIRAIADWDG